MRCSTLPTALLVAACAADAPASPDASAPGDSAPAPADTGEAPPPAAPTWSATPPFAATAIAPVRGYTHRRAVFHLHSPWSHDACDGQGIVDGAANPGCLADLRAALCTARFDVAFLTDHPDYGDARPFDELFHPSPTDAWIGEPGDRRASAIACDDGHQVLWRAGFEDALMPVGLRRHVDGDPATRHALLNASDADAVAAMQAAGARVMVAHTEGRSLASLEALQDLGLHGLEVYNLHAMFAPNIRQDDLGLDPIGWVQGVGPFVTEQPGLEPDLLFLGVHGQQRVSLDRYDALLQRGQVMAIAGTDAHQNVLPQVLGDGERVDSYRRMLSWFSTMLLVDGDGVDAIDAAVAARRAFVAFEVLGTPTGLDVHVEADGAIHELGSDAPAGELVVTCPTIVPGARVGPDAPELIVRVIRDGEVWQDACGRWPVDRGVFRVEIDLVPHHLRPFLGDDPSPWLRSTPWILTNAIRVGLDP